MNKNQNAVTINNATKKSDKNWRRKARKSGLTYKEYIEKKEINKKIDYFNKQRKKIE